MFARYIYKKTYNNERKDKSNIKTLKTSTVINVTIEDIDDLDHVNNNTYVSYFGKARRQWYSELGLTRDELQRKKIGNVIRKLEIEFIREATLGDSIAIITEPLRLGRTSYVLKQNAYNQNHDLLTEAVVTVVMFDTKKRKSIKVVEEIAQNFK